MVEVADVPVAVVNESPPLNDWRADHVFAVEVETPPVSDSQLTPPCAVEEAIKYKLFAPTVLAIQFEEEPTIKFPVEEESAAMTPNGRVDEVVISIRLFISPYSWLMFVEDETVEGMAPRFWLYAVNPKAIIAIRTAPKMYFMILNDL